MYKDEKQDYLDCRDEGRSKEECEEKYLSEPYDTTSRRKMANSYLLFALVVTVLWIPVALYGAACGIYGHGAEAQYRDAHPSATARHRSSNGVVVVGSSIPAAAVQQPVIVAEATVVSVGPVAAPAPLEVVVHQPSAATPSAVEIELTSIGGQHLQQQRNEEL